ncbi:MAG: Unknown protein [uncultured Sulfurovum sp.]|uniref:Arylamine N-acetyltransferase n=1 Tax=uncultured Sulfurovum sp. TaxID=269237 RepID=A0A6S6SEK2_9BACT|nr:MAG: Unknown protein [uncultured Sulfurovum sp.]
MNMNTIILNNEDVNHFLEMIQVKKVSDSLEFLNAIIFGVYEHIPFQNLTLLNSKKRPTELDIIEDMLSGVGGLCNTRNGFMYLLLKALGFKVYFLSASMLQADCHVIILVEIGNEKYLVDTGNGFPYLTAISLEHTLVYSHQYLNHRVIQKNNLFFMQHSQDKELKTWEDSYSFTLKKVLFSSFNTMLDKQYLEIGWGPFTNSIRLNSWNKNGGVIVRDKLLLKLEKNKKREKYIFKNLIDFKMHIQKYYGEKFINLVDIENAWNKYCELEKEKKGIITS